MSIIIHDSIYDNFIITDELVIRLLKTPQLQRLQTISQYGLPDEYYHKKNFSRYEHSLGVYYLLAKFKASRKEQIAGLLHDVSHTAFSHLIDWVIGDPLQENFQDNQHSTILNTPHISQLLNEYHMSISDVTEHSSYHLLEQSLPALCADRIDYSLREFALNDAKKYLNDLITYKGTFAFKSFEIGKMFTYKYLKSQRDHWQDFEGMSRWKIFAEILKYALRKKIVHKNDFNTKSEYEIINILKKHNSIYINKRLAIISHKSLKDFPKTKRRYHKKFRYVDPIIVECKGKRVSELDSSFNALYKKVYEENKKGTQVVRVTNSN